MKIIRQEPEIDILSSDADSEIHQTEPPPLVCFTRATTQIDNLDIIADLSHSKLPLHNTLRTTPSLLSIPQD